MVSLPKLKLWNMSLPSVGISPYFPPTSSCGAAAASVRVLRRPRVLTRPQRIKVFWSLFYKKGLLAFFYAARLFSCIGMPSAGRMVTRSFGVGLNPAAAERRVAGRRVPRMAAASSSAKPMPMQMRGPAPNGR